jgi:hypothetical protein
MGLDYGIKVSKPFHNVLTAGDADMLFSSSWPSLPVAYETTQEDKTGTFTVTNPLGFVPFFQVWRFKDGVSKRYALGAGDSISNVQVTSTEVSITEDFLDPGAADYHIKLYNINLSVAKIYDFTRPPATSSVDYSPDYGIKVTKEGRDIESTDLRDFILHSRAQSPQILSVVTQASAVNNKISFTDPQGYTAWVFGFIRTAATGAYRFVPYFAQSYPSIQFSQSGGLYTYSITYTPGFGDDGATLVVLRDPMFAATDIAASY